jgi:hypothetical protein
MRCARLCCSMRAQLEEAEALLREAVDSLTATVGPDKEDTLNASGALAMVLRRRGNEAETLVRVPATCLHRTRTHLSAGLCDSIRISTAHATNRACVVLRVRLWRVSSSARSRDRAPRSALATASRWQR